MHSLQKQFQDFTESQEIVSKEENLLVAVSGGVDSMVLSHLLLREGYQFVIAHCNFGLRGSESDQDADFVQSWADANNLECVVKKFELKGSTQVSAREERYRWFASLAELKSLDKIATAHHLNDSIETVILNLARGTGIKGVSGIGVKNGITVRPLLFASKEMILEYARSENIEWREDSSNSSVDYNRNLIRHQVLPILKQLNPSLEGTLQSTLERLNYTGDVLNEVVGKNKKKHLSDEGNCWRMDLNWVKEEKDQIILSEVLSDFGFQYHVVKDVFLARQNSGKKFLSETHEVSVDRGALLIQKKEAKKEFKLEIPSPGEYFVMEKKLTIKDVGSVSEFSKDPDVAIFDAHKIQFPIELRPWKEGDKFVPLGMKGSKKVSDFLIDEKVPIALKSRVMVLVSAGEIAWVVGHRLSEKFKLESSSTHALRMQINLI